MFFTSLIFWFLLGFVIFSYSRNLLLLLLILELIGFYVLYYVSITLSLSFSSDFFIIALFALFVIEGVIALSGLISLVSFSGSDYVSSSSFSNL